MRGNQRCFSRVAGHLRSAHRTRVLDRGPAKEPSLTIASPARVVSTDFAPPNKALGATRAAPRSGDRAEFHADAQDLSVGRRHLRRLRRHVRPMFTPDVEGRREVRRVLSLRAVHPTAGSRPGGYVRRGAHEDGAGAARGDPPAPKPGPGRQPPAGPCRLADSVGARAARERGFVAWPPQERSCVDHDDAGADVADVAARFLEGTPFHNDILDAGGAPLLQEPGGSWRQRRRLCGSTS